MSKINIHFDNKDYLVDESSFSSATTELSQHLSTTMSGSGAVIKLGGNSYNVDSVKLSTATNEFVSHLGTVSGSGYKVTVGGVEYGINSAKMQNAVAKLNAVLGNLNSGGGGSGDEPIAVAAGLYETGSNYAVLKKSWDELLADRTISVKNGAATSQASYNGNASSDALAGDLCFPNDGSVTEVGSHSFKYCSKLTGVCIPSKITSIGENAFQYDGALAHVILSEGLVSIGADAFYSCAITELTIPDSVTSIGSTAFGQCQLLERAVIGDGVTALSSNLFMSCKALNEIVINYENITDIGQGAFSYCTSITSVGLVGSGAMVEIPNTITHLNSTFKECWNLEYVELPNSITCIGRTAFYNCDITTITIPASVTEIGREAFGNCTHLTSITYEGTTEQWNAISKYQDSSQVLNWNYKVPATEVVCSDGSVAL